MTHNIHFARSIYEGHENYKEKSLTYRRFKHSDILPIIEQLKNKQIFGVNKVGKSVQGRDIFLISIGTGQKKIFCWSQMHGDESTATAAMFDIINFFLTENHYSDFKRLLLQNVTLLFIPMLNPDGADLYQRRNIFEIDLNRDAVTRQSPESKILHSVFSEIKPDFGFNLHDQDRAYSAGTSGNSAAISFLAPAFDYEKSLTEGRKNSMKLIGEQFNILSQFIPGHISKYQDDFEPRAFGDNFAKSDSSIVLIESGGWRGDREKIFLRKINFVALISSFKCIAEGSYQNEPVETYHSMPCNEKLMMDFIIRNVNIGTEGSEYKVDIGINYEEVNINQNNDFYYKARVEDIGDLSVYSGYNELDAAGLKLEPGKTFAQGFNSLNEINNTDSFQLLEDGVTSVKLNHASLENEFSPLLFNIVLNDIERIEELKVDEVPNFILRKNSKFKLAVINGFPVEQNSIGRNIGNALLFK
jgi:hypothetical protein